MPVVTTDTTFLVQPPANNAVANGDISHPYLFDASAPLYNQNLVFGNDRDGVAENWGTFVRFEPEFTVGHQVTGVSVAFANQNAGSGTLDGFSGGFLVPQAGADAGGDWEAPAGFAGWGTANHFAWAERFHLVFGTQQFPERWQGGAPAFSGLTLNRQTNLFARWALHDNLPFAAVETEATGLVAHMQAYFDQWAHTLRGTGVTAAGIPLCFHLHRPDSNPNVNAYASAIPSDNGFAPFHPSLRITTTSVEVRNANADTAIGPAVDASVSILS